MDEKKKILLGEKDILSKNNEDLFININLNTTFSEIRDSKYENIFDVEKQFNKERNSSRDFRVYGIVDSTIVDCDNLLLDVYSSSYSGIGPSSGVTFLSGFVKSISSTTLVYEGLNVYNKKRGKYILELTGYTHDYVYIKISSNNFNYSDQIYAQQLIFRDAENNFIPYGTQTIDISENGLPIEINNDFYFLYNKHWIKKDLLIEEEKRSEIYFNTNYPIDTVRESSISGSTLFSVSLNKPSPFGLEQADLSVISSNLDTNEIILFDSNFVQIFTPYTINFNSGEQTKHFYFLSPEDTIQEFIENVTFELSNFHYVNTGNTLTHTFFVNDTTVKNQVILNLQSFYNNRNYFNGQVTTISANNYSNSMPAVLRNGLFFDGTAMEFYPIDKFNLKIKNLGANTIFPANPILGIFSDQIFENGQELQFNNIQAVYENTEKHTIKLSFSTQTISPNQLPNYNAFYSGFTINSIPIVDYYLGNSYKFDYDTIVSCLKKTARPSNGQFIGGWNRYNLDTPFDIIEDISGLTVTLIAKSPGLRLDIQPYGFEGNIFDSNSVIALATMTAETLQSFIYSAQNPIEITLSANINANSQAQYVFEFFKDGFNSVSFINTPLNAAIIPPKYYLTSSYNTILRNWDNASNSPIYVHSAVTKNIGNFPKYPNGKFGLYDVGEVYINGFAFLSNLYFDNTVNTSAFLPGGNLINVSDIANASNDYICDFLSAPISVIPETSEYYSPYTNSQIGYLGIISTGNILPPNVNPQRSFDFRTGTTGLYNTYYFSNYNSNASWEWNFYNSFLSSGGTVGTNHTVLPTLSIKQYLQDGNNTYGITDQGLSGITPVSAVEAAAISNIKAGFGTGALIKLVSKNSETPFEFTNFIEERYISGPSLGLNYSNDTMLYVETQPREIAGITINKANNHMGGYSLIRPSTPIVTYVNRVSFGASTYFNQSGNIIIKIALDTPSVNGTESVDVIKLTTSNAILGVDYNINVFIPATIVWAAGEQDKFITISNISSVSFGPPKHLKLQFSNLTNVIPGMFLNTDVMIF